MIKLTREYLIDCILVLQTAKESIRGGDAIFVCSAVEIGAAMWSPDKMSKSDFIYWSGLTAYLHFWIRDMLGKHCTLDAWSYEKKLPTTPEPLRIARERWLDWMIEQLREEIVSA